MPELLLLIFLLSITGLLATLSLSVYLNSKNFNDEYIIALTAFNSWAFFSIHTLYWSIVQPASHVITLYVIWPTVTLSVLIGIIIGIKKTRNKKVNNDI